MKNGYAAATRGKGDLYEDEELRCTTSIVGTIKKLIGVGRFIGDTACMIQIYHVTSILKNPDPTGFASFSNSKSLILRDSAPLYTLHAQI